MKEEVKFKTLQLEKEKSYEPKVGDRVVISDLDNPECHGAVGEIYWLEDGIASVTLDLGRDVWEGSIDAIRPMPRK